MQHILIDEPTNEVAEVCEDVSNNSSFQYYTQAKDNKKKEILEIEPEDFDLSTSEHKQHSHTSLLKEFLDDYMPENPNGCDEATFPQNKPPEFGDKTINTAVKSEEEEIPNLLFTKELQAQKEKLKQSIKQETLPTSQPKLSNEPKLNYSPRYFTTYTQTDPKLIQTSISSSYEIKKAPRPADVTKSSSKDLTSLKSLLNSPSEHDIQMKSSRQLFKTPVSQNKTMNSSNTTEKTYQDLKRNTSKTDLQSKDVSSITSQGLPRSPSHLLLSPGSHNKSAISDKTTLFTLNQFATAQDKVNKKKSPRSGLNTFSFTERSKPEPEVHTFRGQDSIQSQRSSDKKINKIYSPRNETLKKEPEPIQPVIVSTPSTSQTNFDLDLVLKLNPTNSNDKAFSEILTVSEFENLKQMNPQDPKQKAEYLQVINKIEDNLSQLQKDLQLLKQGILLNPAESAEKTPTKQSSLAPQTLNNLFAKMKTQSSISKAKNVYLTSNSKSPERKEIPKDIKKVDLEKKYFVNFSPERKYFSPERTESNTKRAPEYSSSNKTLQAKNWNSSSKVDLNSYKTLTSNSKSPKREGIEPSAKSYVTKLYHESRGKNLDYKRRENLSNDRLTKTVANFSLNDSKELKNSDARAKLGKSFEKNKSIKNSVLMKMIEKLK